MREPLRKIFRHVLTIQPPSTSARTLRPVSILANPEQPNPENNVGEVKWNFEKFLIDENGQLIHRFRSKVTPMDAAITSVL